MEYRGALVARKYDGRLCGEFLVTLNLHNVRRLDKHIVLSPELWSVFSNAISS